MRLKITAKIHKADKVKIFLYHGVKDPANVPKILDRGFDLTKGSSSSINGYGVACFNSEDGVRKHFDSKDIPIIQMVFDGNLEDSWYAEEAVKAKVKELGRRLSPRDFNEALIEKGIDAVITPSIFPRIQEVMVYNLGKLSRLRLLV